MKTGFIYSRGRIQAAVAVAAFLCLSPRANATASPDGCPAKSPDIQEIDCSNPKDAAEGQRCKSCEDATKDQLRSIGRVDTNRTTCQGLNVKCGEAAEAGAGDDTNSRKALATGGAKYANGGQCMQQKKGFSDEAKNIYSECGKSLKSKCKDIGAEQSKADKNAKKCEKAAADSKDTAKDQGDKAQQAGDNAKKSDDNAKKESSGGGMPQMPQMPQKQEDPTASDPSIASQPQVATETKPDIESSKIGGDSKVASPGVGFGGPDTNTSTVLAPSNGFSAASLPSPHDDGKNLGFGDRNLSGGSSPGNFGAVGGGGGSGAGGSQNTTGASVPGEGGAKPAEAANPYEVSGGGGGKLGAPKGFKSGSESDSALDAAAKDTFKNDLGMEKPRDLAGAESQSASEEPEAGYTLFKMVKYRYSELKKKGNI